jgi:hypothetical protein
MPYDDKLWAKKAAGLELEEVDQVRTAAESWRTGLIALTALFATVAIIKGQEEITALSGWGRNLVGILIGLAFITLLIGSAAAMRAAYGFPADEQVVSGSSLRAWSANEARTSRSWLVGATVCFFLAMVLIAGGIAVTWFDDEWFSKTEPAVFVVVESPNGVKANQRCGELVKMSTDGIELKRSATDPIKDNVTVPLDSISEVTAVSSCPE